MSTFFRLAAATNGKLEVLQWARANGCSWDASTGYSAARNGHLEVLQWAQAHECPTESDEIFEIDRYV